VLDDLVVSLCKFTTLLNPTASAEEPVVAFGDDTKARMAAVTVFSIANKFGDFIRTGWRNILDCILRLHKLGLLPARVASDATEDADNASKELMLQGVVNPEWCFCQQVMLKICCRRTDLRFQ
jgi:brefeldin A-resistance guanine nucleotide exchange factor 1